VARQARHTRPLGMYLESALPRAWSAIPWALQACCALLLLSVLCLGGAARAAAAPQPAPEAAAELTPARLADLLDDSATRQQLIDRLRSQASAPGDGAAQSGQAAEAHPSLPTRIARGTQLFLAGMAADAGRAVDELSALASGTGMPPQRRDTLVAELLGLAAVAAATIAAFLLLRALAARAYARIDRWVANPPPASGAAARHGAATAAMLRRGAAMLGALAIDIVIVLLAGLAGYLAGLYGPGQRGVISTAQSLFVNAFVAVEIAKALIRGVFATRYPMLRLFAMDDDVARYWNSHLGRVAAVIGYGLLLAEPLAKSLLSPSIGELLGLVIMLVAYVYAVRIIWRNRLVLRQRLEQRAARASSYFGTWFRLLARTWHVLALGYFTVLLVVSQVDTERALPFMVEATVQSLVALGVGALLIAAMAGVLARRIRLPEDVRRKLPMLEARVNAYVPAALRGLGVLIRIVVALFVLDAWRVFDLSGWIVSDAGAAAVRMVVNVAIILLIAAVAWTVIASIIEHRLSLSEGSGMPTARERTLLALFRNAALIVIITLTVLVVLSQIGVDIAPLIAGAGVVGLAIGFGSQKLVQDIITGVFIQLENGMNQNDVVQVAGIFGTVEKITIRSVGIRTLDGGYHLIPFSSVDVVSNHMRDFSYHLGEYTIAHRESVDDAIQHLRHAFEELMQDELLAPEVLEEISIPGVTSLSDKGVTIRVLIKTTPGMQWAVQRGYNRLVKKHFNAAGIELPYPHTVVYFGQDKNGYAPPANLFMQTDRPDEHGNARAAGQMRRRLSKEQGTAGEDVLGNELDRVQDDPDAEPRPA